MNEKPAIKTEAPPAASGFTIVETIIVLAVAGLILLIVLMAIPTLLRNSRNNQRKQDVQAILEAVSHYQLSNSGDLPSSTAPLQRLPKLTYYSPATINYYTPASCSVPNSGVYITFCISADWTQAPTTPVNNLSNSLDTVLIYNHEKCDPSNPSQGQRAGAGYNDVIALYAIEVGNGSVASQCEQM